MMPWKLLGDYSAYIFGWLVGYSGAARPDCRHHDRRLLPGARPRAAWSTISICASAATSIRGGFNYRALLALAGGIAVALSGLVVPGLRWLYDYAWFAGFLVAGALHFALMRQAR